MPHASRAGSIGPADETKSSPTCEGSGPPVHSGRPWWLFVTETEVRPAARAPATRSVVDGHVSVGPRLDGLVPAGRLGPASAPYPVRIAGPWGRPDRGGLSRAGRLGHDVADTAVGQTAEDG